MFRCITCGEYSKSYKEPCSYCELMEFETETAYYRDGKKIQEYKNA